MRTMDRVRLLTAAAALLLTAASAVAHEVNVFAEPAGGQVVGEVYFRGGGKGRDVEVRLLDAGGAAVATTRTDAAGAFALPAPPPGAYRVTADLGDGHQGSCALVLAGPAAGGDLGDLAGRISELSRRIDRYEHRTGLRDILGGVGYIAGVFGAVCFMKARRSARREGR
ncbi:MAG: carboxypeptidase regulatory-like domain-containing protein [Planctomycetes bacterium]|nr:carboxypeptidase regulatory-like domain-containing protein [Planctomycetota bacterium]